MGDSAAAQTEIARHIGNVRQSILRRLSVGPEQVADRSGARL
jgi:hypothetical protein